MNYQRINSAFEFAAIKHGNQRYKYNPDHYQIAHVSFVGAMLIKFGFDDDTVIAGLLHDVIEDTETELKEVKKKFGPEVTRMVDAETVDQSLPWEERQELMQENIKHASESVKAIKTADVMHQLTLFNDPEHDISQQNYFSDHSPDKVVWKYEKLLEAAGMNWSHPLLDEALVLLQGMKDKHLEE